MNKVVAVAIKYNELLFSLPAPARHHNVLHKMFLPLGEGGLGLNKSLPHEQGFLSSSGNFLSRTDAAQLALLNGQVSKLIVPPNLYSEDLW